MPSGFTPISTTFVSTDVGWVLGTAPCSNDPCTSILRTRDGGRTWRGIPAPRATLGQPDSGRNGDVSVLRFADQSDGWAGVGQLYSTHDGGATWHKQSIGTSTSVVGAIETGGGRVYATTDGCPSQGGNSCAPGTHVYSSPIGSDHWTLVGQTDQGGGGGTRLVVHGSTWFVPAQGGVYVGTGTAAPVRRPNPCPTDEGIRGVAQLAVADVNHLDALCITNGAAGSAEYQLYGTTDGGRAWHKAGGSHVEESGLYGLADNTRGVLLVAVASGNSTILRTTDDGGSFARGFVSPVTGGYGWADLGFTSPTQAVVVLQNKAMYLSRDSGSSFQRVSF